MLSSQLCDACHSSGMACCDHHSFCLPFSCMPQVSNGINLGMWLSPVSQSWNGLREFQFFGPDVTVARSLGLTHEVTPVMEPVIKYQENPHADHPLKFDFFTSTISSVDTPSGSCPMEVSIMGQAGSSATAVSFMGSMLNDTSAGRVKKAGNTMTFYQGNNASGREARILRYKEKKTMRNYEKQIRYATRKTYAEIRPRVRGRFVKNPKSGRPMAPPEYNPENFGSGWFHL